MGDKIIGFIGSDKYELILYLSRILYHLGKKVLLVDFAESKALLQSVTVPETLREDCSYIDYRGIDFIQGKYFEWKMKKDYDYILMDFGFFCDFEAILRCSKLLLVTDLQLHNIKRLQNSEHLLDAFMNDDKFLIIKDVFHCKIKPQFVLEQLNHKIEPDQVYILYQDSLDLKVKVHSQYDHSFSFGKLSSSTKYFLKDITKSIDDDFNEKQINLAYRKAERGI